MYGLLIESIAEFAKRVYGNLVWENVRKKAKIDYYSFSTHQQYSETLMIKIIKALAECTEQCQDDLMENLGIEFVDFVGQFGYDRVLRVLGRHMRDFLNGLDNLHEYMRFSYHKLKPPSFFVEKESANGLILHYRSKRKGFLYYVKGQIRQVGKIFYNLDVKIDVISDTVEGELTHVIFQLYFKNDQFINESQESSASMASLRHNTRHLDASLPIRSDIFFELFPFHVIFKRNLVVVSIGDGLSQAMKNTEGERMTDLFNLARPLIGFTWENIISHTNNVFELTTIEPIRRSNSPTLGGEPVKSLARQGSNENFDEVLKLKGQMLYVKEWDSIIFLATPVLENLEIMFNTGFYINDLSIHDSSRDLVLVGTQQSAELKLALDQEKHKTKALEDSMKKLDVEMKRTDQLLYQMIPKKIADRLRAGEAVMNLCEVVPNCTILFSDVVGFTSTCSQLAPMEVVSMLNGMYTKFDKCLEMHDVYKVETIGDAYMVVSGLPERTNNHAIEIIEMGFDMLNGISTIPNPASGEPMRIRVGCHSGPVVAGVVGLKMPRYCLFGDTVNTASRMESTSEAMKIHISQSTKILLSANDYRIVERGKLEVKGKGEMKTFFVLSKVDADGKSIKCPFTEIFEEYQKKHGKIKENEASKNDEKEVFTLTNGEVQADDRFITSDEMKKTERSMPPKQASVQSSHDLNSLDSKLSMRQSLKTENTVKRTVDPLREENDVRSTKNSSIKNGSIKNGTVRNEPDNDSAIEKLNSLRNKETDSNASKDPQQSKTVTCAIV